MGIKRNKWKSRGETAAKSNKVKDLRSNKVCMETEKSPKGMKGIGDVLQQCVELSIFFSYKKH